MWQPNMYSQRNVWRADVLDLHTLIHVCMCMCEKEKKREGEEVAQDLLWKGCVHVCAVRILTDKCNQRKGQQTMVSSRNDNGQSCCNAAFGVSTCRVDLTLPSINCRLYPCRTCSSNMMCELTRRTRLPNSKYSVCLAQSYFTANL